MPKTLLIEIQQASLVLSYVACLYIGIHWVLFRDRSKKKNSENKKIKEV